MINAGEWRGIYPVVQSASSKTTRASTEGDNVNLAYFDTALGFAAVMLMLSMLITVLVQIVSDLSNLRGKNLFWGVERMLGKIVPDESKKNLQDLADKILTHDALSHTLGRYATAIRPEELKLVLKDLSQAKPAGVIQTAADKILATERDVDRWFNTIMDRVTERFVLHTRGVNIAFAFVLAFALHIDTLHIAKQLASKPEVRTAVVSAALKEAAPAFEQMQKREPVPAQAIRVVAGNDSGLVTSLDKTAFELKSLAQGRDWIAKNVPPAAQEKFFRDYESRVSDLGQKRVQELQADYERVRGWIESSSLELAPGGASYCGAKDAAFKWPFLDCGPAGVGFWHLFGMLVTALFLSLGAPFWFNALRNMSNLRPILAGKVEEDRRPSK